MKVSRRSKPAADLSGYFGGDLLRDVDPGVGPGGAARNDVDRDVVVHGQRPLTGIKALGAVGARHLG